MLAPTLWRAQWGMDISAMSDTLISCVEGAPQAQQMEGITLARSNVTMGMTKVAVGAT